MSHETPGRSLGAGRRDLASAVDAADGTPSLPLAVDGMAKQLAAQPGDNLGFRLAKASQR
jgi:hypothetical protein